MKSFNELTKGSEKLIPGLYHIIIGILFLVIIEAPRDLWINFKRHWKASKNNTQRAAIVIACFIISSFIVYGFLGLYEAGKNQWTKEWRTKILISDSENNIKSFFEKYNERFLAHDCNYMREVGSDEAMFDKLNKKSYTKNEYSCEEFVRVENKIIIPVKIQPIEQNGDKLRSKGEAIVLEINQGKPWKVDAIYFNLWKMNDWNLWHFTQTTEGVSKIPIEINKRS